MGDDGVRGERAAELRRLPAVSTVLERPAILDATRRLGRAAVVRAVRDAIDSARHAVLAGADSVVTDADVLRRARRHARGSLAPVLNATGVIVHTNLGRAPLAASALAAMAEIGAGYASLEYDLDEGGRGERSVHTRELLVELTGAEDALVVNNNAAAVLLALTASAAGREVVVSRGELVEIGGGFRIPDVLLQSGARLVEVGTTNRTHLRDYEHAIGGDTALLLKVHRSNFEIVGFTADVTPAELVLLGRARGVPVVCDAGSGQLTADVGEAGEPTVRALIEAGVELVMFSGDKLLGGPQAGVVVGSRRLIEPMRRHPLMRALRPDKLCLAALGATLRLWLDDPAAVPVVRLARIPASELERRALRLADALRGERVIDVTATIARIGGGAAPLHEIPSWALSLPSPDPQALLAELRDHDPPIIGRIEDDAVLLDLRCVPEAADAFLAEALRPPRPLDL